MEDPNLTTDEELQRLKEDAKVAKEEFDNAIGQKAQSDLHLNRAKKLEELRTLARSRTSSECGKNPQDTDAQQSAGKTKKYESLYQDAMGRLARKQLIQENAALDVIRNSSVDKVLVKSKKLAYQKLSKEIDTIISKYEDPIGCISQESLFMIYKELELIRIFPVSETNIRNIISKTHKLRAESEEIFYVESWKFLNPIKASHIQREIISDFLLILFDKDTDEENLIEDLRRLDGIIYEKIGKRKEECWNAEKILQNFQKLNDNQVAYKKTGVLTEKKLEKLTSHVTKDLTFKPQICEKSKILQSSQEPISPHKRYEFLFKKQKEKEEKIIVNRLAVLEQELEECTFTPEINSVRPQSQDFNLKVEERLYSQRNAPKIVQDPRTSLEKELEKCTFQPSLSSDVKIPKAKITPRGFKESIERLRQANKNRQELKDMLEKRPTGENYEKLKNEKIKPFSFLQRQKNERSVLVYVDVNVGPGKTGRIAIHEDDDPKELASNFCMAYHLNSDMKETLEELLNQQLQDILND
ncbi:unnamed protein product [Blepharisma stoltei]|uniref:Uncharacterized protein n=1 Tax=Blepharisma stoltei TaxID=1481888 RepID=A0AAU9JWU2_9CILI|nr:unnamed protein product [Blepharisma stoltei]